MGYLRTVRAAIFDLDRTLLPTASGPVVSEALREVGLMGAPLPGQNLLFKLFDHFGENRMSMAITKQGPKAAKGWTQSAVREAGAIAAPKLAALVQPWARGILERHRADGDVLVLATTTPHDILESFADQVGFDHLVATRYGSIDGVYDGTVDGHFVWGRGKLDAVRALAGTEGIDVASSAAYSDSYFDAPLLNAVDHAVAVNPDARLAAVAALRGWPIRHLDAPPGVPKILGREPQQLLMPFMKLPQLQLGDVSLHGLEHLPAQGGAIIVSNHRSYFDPVALGYLLAARGRPGRFLAKSELFETPPVRELVQAMGAIPVARGSGSDEPLDQAAAALEAGEVVVVLPEGTIPRGPAFFDPRLDFKPGAARLARMTKAPVIPVGLWGTELVWPRNSKLPRVSLPWQRPDVSVSAGPAVELKYRSDNADTKRLEDAVLALLPQAGREPYEPTADELAATYPSST